MVRNILKNNWVIYDLVQTTSFAGVSNIKSMFENKNKQTQIQNSSVPISLRTSLPVKITTKDEPSSVKISQKTIYDIE